MESGPKVWLFDEIPFFFILNITSRHCAHWDKFPNPTFKSLQYAIDFTIEK